jgi:hypothetical protein
MAPSADRPVLYYDELPVSKGQDLRREYLVDRRFQFKYAILFGVVGVSGAAAAGLTLASQSSALELPVVLTTVIISVLAAAVLALIGIVVSHRIAGPVFVMTRHLATLAGGHYPKMRPLRRGDEFAELFELLQRSLEAMQSRDLEEGARILEAVNQLTPLATTAEAKASLETLMGIHSRKLSA